MKNFFRLQIPAVSENESFARVAVAAFVAQLDPTLDELTEIKTAISEAVTNSIIHGYEENSNGIIEIEVSIEEFVVTVKVKDMGIGITNIEEARTPLYTSKPELERSGMGFTIIENFMDEVTINTGAMQGTEQTKAPLKDQEIKELIVRSQNGDHKAREIIVEKNMRLVWSVVQRFLNRGYEPDDLFQIGSIGLLKSVDKFDLSYDVKFSTYAVPMIIGEIQRFIRDDGTVKVSRSLKEIGNKIRKLKDEMSKTLGRSPTVNEIAEALEITRDEVILAQDANRTPTSIHETVYENDGDPITLLDQIADNSEHKWFNNLALSDAIHGLSERERLIVFLRYYKDQTQSEVAERLGISQVQVSRLEKKILQQIKEYMD
ncbi:MAG: sigF [Bacillales bacterium]|nr:sigF [Bacillales bacterium]